MSIFKEVINNRIYIFEITLNKETSKTTIRYYLANGSLKEVTNTMKAINILINRHNIFQKPIIELYTPQCLMGAILNDIASEMPNSTRNSFSKLYVVDLYRVFRQDGYNWRVESVPQNSHMRRNLI